MKLLVRWLILAVAIVAPAAQAAVVFQDLGTAAPPATINGYAMQPFDETAQAAIVNGTETTTIPGSPVAGSLTTSAAMTKRAIGAGWATWSHGYTGSVFVGQNVASGSLNTITLTLPPNARAFYFYAEPNAFAIHTITATTSAGGSSGPINVNGSAGANGFGFATTAGETIATITITTSDTHFALAEFGINTQNIFVPVTTTPVPTLSEWGMIILSSLLALASLAALRRQQQ